MANNVTFQNDDLATPPDATVVATEEISGAHIQRVKIAIGTSGVDDGDISSSNSMPVSATHLDIRHLNSTDDQVTVSGTNIDIRDLTSVSDSVEVKQATGTNLHAVIDSGSVTVSSLPNVTIDSMPAVTASDLDIRDLSSTQDNVEVKQATGSNLHVVVDSGTITATVDTSALALESGGNLATLASTVGEDDEPNPTKGIAILAKHKSADAHTGDEEGDADYLSLDDFDALRIADQRSMDLDTCNATSGWSAVNDDATNIQVSTNHVFGTGALSFDKANGTANTVYAIIQKTITEANTAEIFEAGGFVGMSLALPTLSNVVGAFLRIGTDSTNYNCWYWDVTSLAAATWLNLRTAASAPSYSRNVGNGWNPASIKYIAVGVEFSGETNTMAGILVDHIHLVKGRVTSSDINNSVTTSVTTPNINIQRVGGVATATNNGTSSSSTLRVTIASDSTGQVKLATGTASIGTLAANSGVDIGDVTINNASGANAVNIQDGGNSITVDGSVTEASAADIKTSVQIMDDWDESDYAKVRVKHPLGAGANGTRTLTLANTAYAVPETASTKTHVLVVYNGSDTDMYWGFATLTSGGILLPAGGRLTLDLGAGKGIFMYCTSAGKVVNHTYIEMEV